MSRRVPPSFHGVHDIVRSAGLARRRIAQIVKSFKRAQAQAGPPSRSTSWGGQVGRRQCRPEVIRNHRGPPLCGAAVSQGRYNSSGARADSVPRTSRHGHRCGAAVCDPRTPPPPRRRPDPVAGPQLPGGVGQPRPRPAKPRGDHSQTNQPSQLTVTNGPHFFVPYVEWMTPPRPRRSGRGSRP